MPTTTKSHVKKGHAYFKNTGRYSEVTTRAKNTVTSDAPSSLTQKNLAPKGNKSLLNVWRELGWK